MNSTPDTRRVFPAAALRGTVMVPGDKSVSHRVAMLSALARGASRVTNYLMSEDCVHTLRAMASLGASVCERADGALEIHGVGGRCRPPAGTLDLGNSGTGLRLLAGLVAGQPLEVTLTGDASLCSRPMGRVREPLEKMGAQLELTGPRGTPPVRVRGAAAPRGIRYELPVASAQVKSAILLAGLFVDGETVVVEKLPTRDHTEWALRALGAAVAVDGPEVRLRGYGSVGPDWTARAWTVPGDFSSAAFWIAGAAGRPGSEVMVRGVGLNPRRTALLDVLRRMGADVDAAPETAAEPGEPIGTVTVRGAALRGTTVRGAEIPNLIDELPALAAAAALAEGETVIRDAAELRVKESDRIRTTVESLRFFGVDAEERPDGLVGRGLARLQAPSGALPSHGDHRIAMTLALLALAGPAPADLANVGCVQTSYPTFWAHLAHLTGQREGA